MFTGSTPVLWPAIQPIANIRRRVAACLRAWRVAASKRWVLAEFLPPNGDNLASSVNLRSGLLAVGALRPEQSDSQEPVALETAVIATGARPGDTAAKRELFTEHTHTVLVFEHGAVIRLSAAVADGQLLFLSNKATGKEVVTQVLRKRSFRPTNCYVDLEFTEDCPGFWGFEFPKKGAAASAGTGARPAAEDDGAESEPSKPATPPSLHEVERLKHEVGELQSRVNSELKAAQNTSGESAAESGVKAASDISAEVAKKEEEKRLEELFAMEAKQEESRLPKRLVAYPQKSAKQIARQKGINRLLVAALALTVCAGAVYYFGAFGGARKKIAGNAAPVQLTQPAAVPVAQRASSASAVQSAANEVAKTPGGTPPEATKNFAANAGNSAIPANTDERDRSASSFDSAGAPTGAISRKPTAAGTLNSGNRATGNLRNPAPPAQTKPRTEHAAVGLGRTPPEIAAGGNADVVAAPSTKSETNSSSTAAPEDYVTPKLIKSSNTLAPPEAIRNYVAGNVLVDAVVDTTGHVRTVTIVSGPAKLYPNATEAMKQYLYQPAKKNGKPVTAHVQVSLQFWYAP